ncbi:hypothetical protein [Burkholderia pseudomallei]|uniref:hypothetical protein n=1 Tax=Burkholderia pseudomallei TaxID=28450 RepID=UPI0005DADCA0|nr:hypothetical protein [Burkholderia pseudomallei]CAJ3336862.1 Uncharacterised protein [Burkholderia pseudomallei]CAJ3927215.1 Uncharacterised protein [Burkholderia pseudomallei]CAJ3978905.1 Uncharacterised protein [Burkholderia pseudomallei]CAJ5703804.1 Uncharacterised protein [Burkholderia pseudomallei]CAJ7178221.1 Uncharacterised protein [Burkholderia pseudomallei]
MKHGRITVLAASACFAVLTTGCATVTGGTTQTVSMKTQKDAVDIAGADCVLSNSKGTYKVTTPGKVSVHRAKDDLSVKCTKDGEADATTTVKSSHRTGAMVGNILLLGVASFALEGVDRADGAAYAYPDDIMVAFGKAAESEAANASAVQSTQAQAETTSTTDTAPSTAR